MKHLIYFFILFFFIQISTAQNNKLIIGTYTNSCQSNGIYVYEFDSDFENLVLKSESSKVINPSYLSVSKESNFIYAVNENGKQSTISSFNFDSRSGKINFLNSQNASGEDPCYVIDDEKNIIVANYSSGNISVFGKNTDKSLTEIKQIITHYGKGINPKRQESPHVHMVYFSQDKKYILSNDLGNDSIYVYDYNQNSEKDILKLKQKIAVKPGSGPRHLVFNTTGEFVYVLNELTSTITSFSFKEGNLKQISEISTVSKDYKGAIGSADIHISPDGNYLYATNRGDVNNITVCKLSSNGKLKIISQQSTLGESPRNFAIDPSGNYLLVANQKSNEVVIFNRNKKTGKLTDSKKRIPVCSPVCLVFL